MRTAIKPVRKLRLAAFVIPAIFLLILVPMLVKPVNAASANIAFIPGCTTQTGFFLDTVHVLGWQPCYDTGILYSENFATNPPTLTAYDIHSTIGTFNEIAIWGDSSYIYNIGRGESGKLGGVAQGTYSTPATVTTPVTGLTADVGYPTELNNHLYIPDGTGVYDYNIGTPASSQQITTGQQMFQCTNDGIKIFCTSQVSGTIWQIDPSTDVATQKVSGLNSPYGIAAGGGSVYVALHGTNVVEKISQTTWTVSATSSLPSCATPYGVALYSTYAVVTSDATNLCGGSSNQAARNVYVLNQSDLTTANTVTCPVTESGTCLALFILVIDSSGNVYVGFQGSAGTAQISGAFNFAGSTVSSSSSTSYHGGPSPLIFSPAVTFVSPQCADLTAVHPDSQGMINCTGYAWLNSFMNPYTTLQSINYTLSITYSISATPFLRFASAPQCSTMKFNMIKEQSRNGSEVVMAYLLDNMPVMKVPREIPQIGGGCFFWDSGLRSIPLGHGNLNFSKPIPLTTPSSVPADLASVTCTYNCKGQWSPVGVNFFGTNATAWKFTLSVGPIPTPDDPLLQWFKIHGINILFGMEHPIIVTLNVQQIPYWTQGIHYSYPDVINMNIWYGPNTGPFNCASVDKRFC